MDRSLHDVAAAIAESVAATQTPRPTAPRSRPKKRFLKDPRRGNGKQADIEMLNSCLRRICSWRVPPNWSAHDWFDEMRELGVVALWRAKCDYDRSRGVPLEAFERLRVLASARTRYRQEWNYALRCNPIDDSKVELLVDEPGGFVRASRQLSDVLAQIPEVDRRLIEQLFWAERSEAAVAQKLGISQQAVSKRKGMVLRKLRNLLGDHKAKSCRNRSSAFVGSAVLHSMLWLCQDLFFQEVTCQWL
jgi:DNA-directed RNA polymerase specialized sigma24 family protein